MVLIISGLCDPGKFDKSVLDSHNAPIAEARLAVWEADGAVLQQTATNVGGRFELAALPAGLYASRVEARGFQARTMRSADERPGSKLPRTWFGIGN
jgi:hypothetical protein